MSPTSVARAMAAKMEALRSAGVFVADSPAALGSSMIELLKG
jgi:succinyl-CoA synthetase alpha subunit